MRCAENDSAKDANNGNSNWIGQGVAEGVNDPQPNRRPQHPLTSADHVPPQNQPLQETDKHAEPQMVATKLMRWSWKLTNAERGGLTSRQFIRYHLMRLKLGDDLTHLKYGNMPRRIASVEEVLALKPELAAEVEPSSC